MLRCSSLVHGLLDVLYPRLCAGCGGVLYGSEQNLCLKCIASLPRTGYHNKPENKAEQLFYGKVRVERASSFLFFEKKSAIQHMLHELKYKGRKELGKELGSYFGADIVDSPLGEVDAIIPIPLHPKRKAWRGYNQSEWIAMGLAQVLDKPLLTNVVSRVVETQTQTKKDAAERWVNVQNIFQVTDCESIRGKHVLVVDDVITTGSTVESCVAKLLEVEGVRVSVASLALAE